MDEDSGSNGQITFTLLDNPGGTFRLAHTGPQASLTLREWLDFETTTSYELTILAHDGGVPVLSSSTTIELQVIDEADTVPMFNTSSYTAILSEDTTPIAHFLTVFAISNDSPSLASLQYYIIEGNQDGR